jgi:hypothetical protein
MTRGPLATELSGGPLGHGVLACRTCSGHGSGKEAYVSRETYAFERLRTLPPRAHRASLPRLVTVPNNQLQPAAAPESPVSRALQKARWELHPPCFLPPPPPTR